MSNPWTNRPMKFGEKDRREFIVQDTEVALSAINDSNGNPIYVALAKAGTQQDEDKWQIRKITYDENQGVTRVQWAVNSDNVATTNYEFVYSSVDPLTITNITQANPAVVTVSSIGDLQNGDLIVIYGVNGMTEVNFDGSNYYTVAGIAGATFQLSGIDSLAFSAYVDSGEVFYGEAINYSYS